MWTGMLDWIHSGTRTDWCDCGLDFVEPNYNRCHFCNQEQALRSRLQMAEADGTDSLGLTRMGLRGSSRRKEKGSGDPPFTGISARRVARGRRPRRGPGPIKTTGGATP